MESIVEDIISCKYGVSFNFCYRILLQLTSLNDRLGISNNLYSMCSGGAFSVY